MLVRVLRDMCPLYRRRFQVYAGGYSRRGGPEISWQGAMRYWYSAGKILFSLSILVFGTLVFTYCMYVCERDYSVDWTTKNTLWFTLFNLLLCGYDGMFPNSAYGQWVLLFILVFALTILSLAIEVIFGLMGMDDSEMGAVEWINEYEGKEGMKTAATSYLAYWWRYAAFAGESPAKVNLHPEEYQEKKTELYRNAVLHFNEMRRQSGALATMDTVGKDSTAEDLDQASEDLVAIKEALGAGAAVSMVGGADVQEQLTLIEQRQQVILERLEQLQK
eukprot:TRINITY_DN764_c0_g1_i4.p2 TRINITY_DN764_c0_g1~~TRINITY_DN764_c0_g1_i4.p2  ORF type:complete len:276 (-),score=91.91 TRINITY_DN764_c0_g1_i4:188-1015(-)